MIKQVPIKFVQTIKQNVCPHVRLNCNKKSTKYVWMNQRCKLEQRCDHEHKNIEIIRFLYTLLVIYPDRNRKSCWGLQCITPYKYCRVMKVFIVMLVRRMIRMKLRVGRRLVIARVIVWDKRVQYFQKRHFVMISFKSPFKFHPCNESAQL